MYFKRIGELFWCPKKSCNAPPLLSQGLGKRSQRLDFSGAGRGGVLLGASFPFLGFVAQII